MRTSAETDKIGPALVAALGQMSNPEKTQEVKVRGKTKEGKSYEYSYFFAPMPQIVDACRPKLEKNGLALFQSIESIDGHPAIVTTIMHASGQWVSSDPLIMHPAQSDPQSVGGAITYGRRYSLSAMLGLAADEDDDAHGQTHGGQQQSAPKQQGKAPPKQESGKGELHFPMDDYPAKKDKSHLFANEKHPGHKWNNMTWREMAQAHEESIRAGHVTEMSTPIQNIIEAQYMSAWNREQAVELDRMARFKVEQSPMANLPQDTLSEDELNDIPF